jgi:UPF0755 protein
LSQQNSNAVERRAQERTVRRFKKPLIVVLILLLIAVIGMFWLDSLSAPYDRTKTTYTNVVIENGDDLEGVAETLEEAGIIKSASRFVLLSKLSFAGKFRSGTYALSPSMNSMNIINTLHSGLTTATGFTIPAGYTVDQIANALDRDELADKDAFLEAAASPALSEFEILKQDSEGLTGTDLVEGFLLPDEYVLSSDADESMMVIMMVDNFSNFFNEDYLARADELGMSPRQVVIVASIIEKETSVDKEKAKISAVLHNRYNLELLEEGEIPNVPLCSPSKESIIAALYPDEEEYTHYVLSSKLDGTHVFTSDDEEYNALLAEYNAAVEARDAKEAEEKAAEDAKENEDGAESKESTESEGEGGEE